MKPCGIVTLLLIVCSSWAQGITIATVPVGNAGNAPHAWTGHGAVEYDFRMGSTEVTNAQYVEFLNAKAKSNLMGLYNSNMETNVHGGITQSGASGSFSYATKPNMDDKPVNYVNWYDAIRFANWLNNGQGSGDTESGAYTILGGSIFPSNGASITRNAGATWFLPSEDEWYKAAYHQPAAQGGDATNYWQFPTKSNSAPTPAHANAVGDISNPGMNVANYDRGAVWGGVRGARVTTVGSAGPLSESFYGTSDQGGNVYEWNEALILIDGNTYRGLRGGEHSSGWTNLRFADRWLNHASNDDLSNGFRVATIPEPSTYALAAIGVAALLAVRRRKR